MTSDLWSLLSFLSACKTLGLSQSSHLNIIPLFYAPCVEGLKVKQLPLVFFFSSGGLKTSVVSDPYSDFKLS